MAMSRRDVAPFSQPDRRRIITDIKDVIAIVDETTEHGTPEALRSARRKTLLVMFIALGGVFVDAYDFTSLGMGVIQLRTQFHLSSAGVGMMSATMAVSALFGALFGGHLVDKLGRRRMFLLDLYFFVFSAIGAALAPNVWVLVAFRLMMGLGVGLDFPVALSFVAEFSNRASRGRSVNLSYLNWYIAAIVGFIASYVGYLAGAGADLWRYAVGFGAVPAAVLLVMRYKYMLESPLWAAHRGDLEGAAEILARTRHLDVEVRRPPAAGVTAPPLSLRQTYAILFSPRYRRRSILAAVIACAQSIEYYAVIFYLPVISQLLFGHSLLRAIEGGITFSAIGLVGATIQASVCDRTGIRPLTITGGVMAAAGLVGIALGHSGAALGLEAAMVAVFMLGHTVGPGPQGMAYGTLSFPTSIRGSAVGWTQGMLRVGSVIGFLVFPISLATLGFSSTFMLLALAPVTVVLVTLLLRWEPIGVDIEAEEVGIPAVTPSGLGTVPLVGAGGGAHFSAEPLE